MHANKCTEIAVKNRSGILELEFRLINIDSRCGWGVMFENLTQRLSQTLKNIQGRGRLTEENVQETLREVRRALLEADVALPVVRALIDKIKARAIGQEVGQSLTPGQAFIKIVQAELVEVMGQACVPIQLSTEPPAVILMAGLQGAGKTTSVAKLGHHLQTREKKKVLVVSADVYRPAAIQQLETLADSLDLGFFPSDITQTPREIAASALEFAKKRYFDVLIVDTAGRLHIDDNMMQEIQGLEQQLSPIETLFVVDAMTGQDAANTAKAFHEKLSLTGVILTKVDGDARGGAALSVRYITGQPIKFLGVGEKTDALEPFHPDRIASRILGMGDVLSLIEELEQQVDKKKAAKLAQKVKTGKGFDLIDFQQQLEQMRNMGGIGSMLGKLPGVGALPDDVKAQVDGKMTAHMEAIISSMTLQERKHPEIIKGSRKRRIAQGCGLQVQDVNRLLKQFFEMQKMMKKMSKKGGMRGLMSQMQGMMGQGKGPRFR